MSGGDSALSISMTAVSSLIIPFSLPLMLVLLVPDAQLVFPLKTAILQLTAVTLVPVLLGMATRHWAKGRWFEGFSLFAGPFGAGGAVFDSHGDGCCQYWRFSPTLLGGIDSGDQPVRDGYVVGCLRG